MSICFLTIQTYIYLHYIYIKETGNGEYLQWKNLRWNLHCQHQRVHLQYRMCVLAHFTHHNCIFICIYIIMYIYIHQCWPFWLLLAKLKYIYIYIRKTLEFWRMSGYFDINSLLENTWRIDINFWICDGWFFHLNSLLESSRFDQFWSIWRVDIEFWI